MTNNKITKTTVWKLIALIICLIIAISTLLEGCTKGICPNYISTHGIIQSFNSKKYENKEHYTIYADILWNQDKICNANLGTYFTTNTTDEYDIGENIDIYVSKKNKDNCIIKLNSNMETNIVASMIFFGFTGTMLLCMLSNVEFITPSASPQIKFVKVNNINNV